MKFLKSLQATALLSFYSLFPHASSPPLVKPSTSATSRDIHSITSAQFACTIANLDRFLGNGSPVAILFKEANILAAPLLLFRLKRSGYSSCIISRQKEGLCLTLRR